jgi:uncharacterized membrane protein YphA (DoxX/SURF4 family)
MNDSKLNKVGWVLSGLLGLAFMASSYFKFAPPPEAAANMEKVGLAPSVLPTIGVLEFASALLFLIPKTSFVGAILLTGYMGGAIFAHLRIGDSVLYPVIFPILVWVGYGLRYPATIRTALFRP